MLTRLSAIASTNPRLVRQFLKFAVVGAIGTCVDVSILYVLHELAGLNLYLSNAVSFTVAVINNYLLNSFWTFGDQEKRHGRQIVQFFIVSVIGLLLSSGLLYIFHDIYGLHYLAAKVLSILVVLFWNFTANRLWTFKQHPGPAAHQRV
jgi:putative flippase GtrA